MAAPVGRVFQYLGAGFTGSFLYQNIDQLVTFSTNFGSSFLRALAATGANRDGEGGFLGRGARDVADPAVKALALQVERLAAEMRSMNRPVTVVAGEKRDGFPTTFVITAATATGGVAFYVYVVRGSTFTDLMYVTRHSFKRGLATLTAGLSNVSSAVIKVHQQMSERFDLLSDKVDSGLDAQRRTQEKVEQIREELSQVGLDVAGVQRMVQDVEEKIDRVVAAQGVTNKGVHLLCSAFHSRLGAEAEAQHTSLKNKLGEYVHALPPAAAGIGIPDFPQMADGGVNNNDRNAENNKNYYQNTGGASPGAYQQLPPSSAMPPGRSGAGAGTRMGAAGDHVCGGLGYHHGSGGVGSIMVDGVAREIEAMTAQLHQHIAVATETLE